MKLAAFPIVVFVVALALTLCAVGASAQENTLPSPSPRRSLEPRFSLGEITPTPEMWFYEQHMRNYSDPRFGVRQNAEYRAAQRRYRLAAQKWFGISNSRPTVNPTPTHTSYSASWTANSYDPNRWTASAFPGVIYHAKRTPIGYGLW
jgi:hypothetical protein